MCRVCYLGPSELIFSSRAVLVPRLVRTPARCTLHGRISVGYRMIIPGAMPSRTVAARCYYLVLGSYVAIFLAPEALFQATLPFVPLASKQLALLDQAFVDDLVC